MKELSPEELKNFDGKEDRPAYVAAGGKVYDVSKSPMWKGGEHMAQHKAGSDLSADLERAPHGTEIFERVEEVGTLADQAPASAKSPPSWALFLLGFHPHPITVHFPQALLSVAPVFLILSYIFTARYFERTAYYLLFFGLLLSIPSILTGLFHWIYKFGRSDRSVFKFKILMSVILFILAGVTFFVHMDKGHLDLEQMDTLVLVLYLLLIPVIVPLGHAGGRIVFGGGKK